MVIFFSVKEILEDLKESCFLISLCKEIYYGKEFFLCFSTVL